MHSFPSAVFLILERPERTHRRPGLDHHATLWVVPISQAKIGFVYGSYLKQIQSYEGVIFDNVVHRLNPGRWKRPSKTIQDFMTVPKAAAQRFAKQTTIRLVLGPAPSPQRLVSSKLGWLHPDSGALPARGN